MSAFNYRYGPEAKPYKASEDMNIGSLVDCLLTPPYSIDEMFAVCDNLDKRTKEGKANAKAIEASGLIAIKNQMLSQGMEIRDTLETDPDIGPILAQKDEQGSQVPHFFNDAYGRPCRCLPDIITKDGCVYDLKKTKSAVPRRFYWQAIDLGYDLQMAHIALGFEDKYGHPPNQVGIICFEWEPPYDRSLLIFDETDIALGLSKREEAFTRILECQASGIWPSHGCQPFRYARPDFQTNP
jgi:hypothetical protein